MSLTNEILGSQFHLSLSAPMCTKQLFDDIGFLGDTLAAQSILEGTYVFPPDTNRHTRLLLEEPAKIFTTMMVNKIYKMVTLEDFQYWWRSANEDTQSSKYGIHFGHYMAASYSDEVSALHVAKFNLVMKSGVPLE